MKYPWMGLVFLLLAGAVEAGEDWEVIASYPEQSVISPRSNTLVMVDEELLKRLAQHGADIGGRLMIAPHFYDAEEQLWKPVDYTCYQRMREAMRMMRLTVDAAYRGSIVTATPQPSPTPKEIWDATMKECVQ